MLARILNRIVVVFVVCVIVLGSAVLAASASGVLTPEPTTVIDPDAYVFPLPSPVSPAAGLAPASAAPLPDGALIDKQIAALDRTGIGVISYCVTDLTGKSVAGLDAQSARVPASSWKLLTMLAALSKFDRDKRFATTVVESVDGIVLVGGGDPMLTTSRTLVNGQATLLGLAEQTAQALKEAGRAEVVLGYDDSLFAGPAWNPDWPGSFVGNIAPVSALAADASGGPEAGVSSKTASTFSNLLAARGIAVTSVRPERGGAAANELARVESLPLGEMIRHIVAVSDNYGSEVLMRHIGLAAGQDGSIASSQGVLTSFLQSHGLWSSRMAVSDGSGMSLLNRATPTVLAAAVRMAYGNPIYADILDGLPVAGVDGTLYDRFDDPGEADGRGVVHAKTGTHDEVRTLTGFVQSGTGGVLVFSFMLNEATDDDAAVDWIDQAAAVLAAA